MNKHQLSNAAGKRVTEAVVSVIVARGVSLQNVVESLEAEGFVNPRSHNHHTVYELVRYWMDNDHADLAGLLALDLLREYSTLRRGSKQVLAGLLDLGILKEEDEDE